MNIKAVIFDAGGVLHSSENDHMCEDIKNTLKISEDEFEASYPSLIDLAAEGQISEEEFWIRFKKSTKSNEKLPEISLFKREYIKRFRAQDNVLKLVKTLKSDGYKVGVLSDTIPTHFEVNQEKGLYNDFSVKVFSYQVGVKKPQPRIYKLALERLGVEPEEAIFIDDTNKYVVAAEKLGINGIQFTSYEQLIEDLRRFGVMVKA